MSVKVLYFGLSEAGIRIIDISAPPAGMVGARRQELTKEQAPRRILISLPTKAYRLKPKILEIYTILLIFWKYFITRKNFRSVSSTSTS